MLTRTIKNIMQYRRTLLVRPTPPVALLRVPAFVINLERSEARRRYITPHLAALGIPATLIPAFDGRKLELPKLISDGVYSEQEAISAFSRPLSMAEIGCALSHASIYRKIVAESIPIALILEDDAQLVDGAAERIAALIDIAPDGWELIQLRFDSREVRRVSPELVEFEFRDEWPVAATAYLLTLAGARKLMENILPVRYPADSLLGRAHYWKIRAYGALPELAGVNNVFPSAIQGDRNLRFRASNAIKSALLRFLG